MGGCGKSTIVPLCCFFLITCCPSSNVGPLHGLQLLQIKPAPPCSLQELQGIPVAVPGAPPPPFPPLLLLGLFLTSSPHRQAAFSPFSQRPRQPLDSTWAPVHGTGTLLKNVAERESRTIFCSFHFLTHCLFSTTSLQLSLAALPFASSLHKSLSILRAPRKGAAGAGRKATAGCCVPWWHSLLCVHLRLSAIMGLDGACSCQQEEWEQGGSMGLPSLLPPVFRRFKVAVIVHSRVMLAISPGHLEWLM